MCDVLWEESGREVLGGCGGGGRGVWVFFVIVGLNVMRDGGGGERGVGWSERCVLRLWV